MAKRKKNSANISTFAEAIRKNHDFTNQEATAIVRTFLETMEESLKDGRDIVFPRIGAIRVKEIDERLGMLPQTSQRIILSKRRTVKFDTSPVLLDSVNEGSGFERTYRIISESEAQEIQQTEKED
ncbi:HU family DNA-binding protein [Enterococcus faecalis]